MIAIPAGDGETTVYTAAQPGDGPQTLGCELVGADGEVERSTRMDSLTFALPDPVTVDGTTWHPFTEIELASSPATLTCPGDTLASAVLSKPTAFGSLSGVVGWFALGTGVLFLCLGVVALVALRLLPEGRRRGVWRYWGSSPSSGCAGGRC